MLMLDKFVGVVFVGAGALLVGAELWGLLTNYPYDAEALFVAAMFTTLGIIAIRHGVQRATRTGLEPERVYLSSNASFWLALSLNALAYAHAFFFPAERLYGDFSLWAWPSLAALVTLPISAYLLFPFRRRTVIHYGLIFTGVLYPVVHLMLLGRRLR